MKFRRGNIVKDSYGYLMIIEGIRQVNKYNTDKKMYDVIDWISFDTEGCGGSTRVGKYTTKEICHCDMFTGDHDIDCESCKGTGSYKRENLGTNGWVKLADNCKDYIKSKLLKNFDF